MKTNLLLTLAITLGGIQSYAESKCDIQVERQVTVADPTIFGSTTSEDCKTTDSMAYSDGAHYQARLVADELIRECQSEGHQDCRVTKDVQRGGSYPGSDRGTFYNFVCVTGNRVKVKTLNKKEFARAQCQKIDKCIEDALNNGDDKLYQTAKDLFALKNCGND